MCSKLRLFEPKSTKFKIKHHFLHRINKRFLEVANFTFPWRSLDSLLYKCLYTIGCDNGIVLLLHSPITLVLV